MIISYKLKQKQLFPLKSNYLFSEVQDPNFCEDDSEFTSVLLWAILLNRKDVAKICWLKCRNFLCKK